jgi:uncharacterized OB-fold protein
MTTPPPPPSPSTDPFWDGIAAAELRLPYCASCDEWDWYPLAGVPHRCGRELAWRAVAPTGTVYATTTVRRPFLPGASREDVPLTTALVELDDAPGVRLVARFERGDEPRIGDRVRGRFESAHGRPDLRFETCGAG